MTGSFFIVGKVVVGENDSGVFSIISDTSELSEWYGFVLRHDPSSSKYEFSMRVWVFLSLVPWQLLLCLEKGVGDNRALYFEIILKCFLP